MPYHHGNLREALLERAAEVIAADGVEAVSLRGLARDLDVSHAAPSRHFEDRAALFVELAKEGFRRALDAMDEGARAAGPDPVARYRALGRSFVEFARRDPAFFRVCVHPEIRASADESLLATELEWFHRLREGAAEAQRAGWRPDADVDALMAFSVAAAMGAAILFADGPRRLGLADRDESALADAVLDLVVGRDGAAPPVHTNDLPPSSSERRVS